MDTGASGGAAGAAIAQATKASGVIVRVNPINFVRMVELNDQPLVVHAAGGLFSVSHQYLTSYRGPGILYQVRDTADASGLPIGRSREDMDSRLKL